MAEIISFPKDRIVRENTDYVNENLQKMKDRGAEQFADYLVQDLTEDIITSLSTYGVDIEDEQFIKDFTVVVDFFKASIYRSLELDHHLHNYIDTKVSFVKIDKLLDEDGEEEEDSLPR